MMILKEALKKLFSKPVTQKYPKEKPKLPEGFRGRIAWNKDTCIFCMLCQMNCPTGAITINKAEKTWSIDVGKCIFCGRCHDVCPTNPKSVYNTDIYEIAEFDRENLKLTFKKD